MIIHKRSVLLKIIAGLVDTICNKRLLKEKILAIPGEWGLRILRVYRHTAHGY